VRGSNARGGSVAHIHTISTQAMEEVVVRSRVGGRDQFGSLPVVALLDP